MQDSQDEKRVTFKFKHNKKISWKNYEEKDVMKSDIRQSAVSDSEYIDADEFYQQPLP